MRINEDYINSIEQDEIVKKHELIQEEIDATVQHILDDTYDDKFDVQLQGYIAIYKPKDNDELERLVKKSIKVFGEKCDLNWIDTSEITSMDYLFEDTNFDGNISEWNTSKVTSMYNMFCACNFNGDISKWDVSNVTDMDEMFDGSYFEGDISSWKINDYCTISDMFKGCKILLIHIPKDILVHLDARDITKW